jgi:putative aldouronate transport system substrate-binding protein
MGYRRIRDELEVYYGIKVNDKRVLNLDRKLQIHSSIKHRPKNCLDDKIKKYPNLAKVDSSCFEPIKVDNKIFAIGSTGLPFPSNNNMIRKDWLDKVGMKAPTDQNELYAVLKAFKERDPGQQGANNIPFVDNAGIMNPGISAMFGILYDYEAVNGKIIDTRLTSNYKSYLEYMNKLYKEGLLDQDYPINKNSNVQQKMAAGNAGFYVGWVEPGRDAILNGRKAGNANTSVVAIAPFKDSAGKQRTRSNIGGDFFGFIPSSSKNADYVLDWINTFLDAKNFEYLVNGKEGEDYTVKDGKRYPILPRFDEQRGNMFAYFPIQDGNAYYSLWQMRTRKQAEYSEIFESLSAVNDKYKENNVLAFAPPFSKASQTVKIINDYIGQEATKFISGARSLSEFDKYVQEVKAKGADDVVNEYNDWYSKSAIKK